MRSITYYAMVMAMTTLGMGFGPGPIVDAVHASEMDEKNVQVLASGPIHEAFAEAVTLTPEPGMVVPTPPPKLIEEIPPEQKPDGAVQWIPGYWAWDDEWEEHIWISGVWRVAPPCREWVPGYWFHVRNGYQWIPGYWGRMEEKKAKFLPEPPESLEAGPNRHAPSPDYTWIPGFWVWQHGRYVWRPGYWTVADPDWIWVPSHYAWTPRGYISVGGYWDYTIGLRGVLFAPVFIPRSHLGLRFTFSPGFVIDLNLFDDALFLRPRYCHYYFGDYYATRYYKRGIYPWFSVHARHVFYDPIYVHKRWKHRHDREWEKRVKKRFHERRDMKGPRPPRSVDLRKGPDSAGRSSGEVWRSPVKPLDRDNEATVYSRRVMSPGDKEQKKPTRTEKASRTDDKGHQKRTTLKRDIVKNEPLKKTGSSKVALSRSTIIDRSHETENNENSHITRRTVPGSVPDTAASVQKKYRMKESLNAPDKPAGRSSTPGKVEQQPTSEKYDNPLRPWSMPQQSESKVQQPGVERQRPIGKNRAPIMERSSSVSRARGKSSYSESRDLKPGVTKVRSKSTVPGKSRSPSRHP